MEQRNNPHKQSLRLIGPKHDNYATEFADLENEERALKQQITDAIARGNQAEVLIIYRTLVRNLNKQLELNRYRDTLQKRRQGMSNQDIVDLNNQKNAEERDDLTDDEMSD